MIRARATIHVARMSAVVVGLLLLTVLPFCPGRHDVLAGTLSVIAQALGFAGLILVPIGALWLVHGSMRRTADEDGESLRHRYTLVVIFLLTILGLFAAVAAAAQFAFSFGIGIAVVSITLAWRAARRSKLRMKAAAGPDRATPLGCIVVPIAILFLQRAIAAPATECARARAIRNSAALIEDIEKYRSARGHYPLSLHSLWEDYSTSVIGISRYYYEPCGEAYNLFFEEPTFEFGARVIVMYNPRDEQVMTSHDMDLLRRTPAELELHRNFSSVRPASQPHWKCFVFD